MNVEELEEKLERAKKRLDTIIDKRSRNEDNTQKDWDEYESASRAFYTAKRELAIIKAEEYVVPHPIGITPSPSGSGEVVIQTEDFTFVVFLARLYNDTLYPRGTQRALWTGAFDYHI